MASVKKSVVPSTIEKTKKKKVQKKLEIGESSFFLLIQSVQKEKKIGRNADKEIQRSYV
jgi:uncharacterized membrane protein